MFMDNVNVHELPLHRIYVEREKLDRRRLLEAHFKYAILTVTSWYPEFFQEPLVFLYKQHI